MNRSERRTRGRPKGSKNKVTALPHSLAARRQRQSQNAHPSPPTGTTDRSSVDSAEDHEDTPPADHTEGRESADGGYRVYRGKTGTIKTNLVALYGGAGAFIMRWDVVSGRIVLESSEKLADAWLAWGRQDKRIMALLSFWFGSPAAAVLAAHLMVLNAIARAHGRSPFSFLPMPRINLAALQQLRRANRGASGGLSSTATGSFGVFGHSGSSPEPTPSETPYQPAGPFAPTEDAGPPPAYSDDGLRVYPEEGITADEEVQIRTAATRAHLPYQEVKNAYVLARAQERMAQNGKQFAPGGLGMPVARE